MSEIISRFITIVGRQHALTDTADKAAYEEENRGIYRKAGSQGRPAEAVSGLDSEPGRTPED